MEPPAFHLQLPRKRRGREIRLLDRDALLVAETEDEVPTEERIDARTQRELHLANVEAPAGLLRAAVGAEVGNDVGDRADVRDEAGIARLRRSGRRHRRWRAHGTRFAGDPLELSDQPDRICA